MRRDAALILDMLIAARKIQRFTAGMSAADFQANEMAQSAVIREIQVIGEAARIVSDAMKASHPTIEWREISGMRNRVIHEYFDIDLDLLWDTVQNDIPLLIEQLQGIVPPEKNDTDS